MTWLGQWLSRRRLARELTEEIQAHLDEKVDELMASGMSLEDATQAARRAFGNVGVVEDASRDVWAWLPVDDLLSDARYALRTLRKNPVFTTVALLTIAIGIGANTAVFTVLNSVLLKPLNYPQPDELVSLHQIAPGAQGLADFENGLLLSPSMYFTYSEQNRTFQSLGVWVSGTANVTGLSAPEQVRTVTVSDGVLQTMNVRPVAGRWLLRDDQVPHGPERVMLSYAYWQRRFGGSPAAVGQTLMVDSRLREIVGVMPRGFQIVDADFDLLVPFAFERGTVGFAGFGTHGIARLKPGATIAEANADVARMVPIWMDSWGAKPGDNGRIYETWKITPRIRPLKQEVIGNVGELLWVVMGTIGVVMLIACANVTNLVLVRVEARQQELALRGALGAGWKRIMRTLLVESEMLALMGGVLGLVLAYVGVRLLVAANVSNLPRVNDISLDARGLGFSLALSALSGVLFGVLPAMKYARPRAGSMLRSEARGSSASRERHRVRNSLVAGQVAMALVLLVSAGLMIRTFDALRHVDPGFTDPPRIQLLRISIPEVLATDPQQVAHIQNAIVDGLKSIQGVQAAGFASQMPMEGFDGIWDSIVAEDKTYPEGTIGAPLRTYKYLSPGLLQTAGTRLMAGRDITWSEVYGLRPVVLLSENLARDMWGTPAAAIGKHVREYEGMPWYEVIGVVQDVHEKGVQAAAPAIAYWPPIVVGGFGGPLRTVTFAVRSDRAGTASFLNEIRRAVWSVNSNLPLASERTMQDVYDKSLARTSFTLVMLGIAGAMALALGIIGIYGVMSYTVAQRKREIGIRLALGAQRADVLQLILRQGMRFTLLGVLIGIAAGLGLTRLMSSLLYGVTAHDPVTFAGVSVLLIFVALLACYIPGRRAIRVDPVVALRYD
jgi:putative ABC transport system permease protein